MLPQSSKTANISFQSNRVNILYLAQHIVASPLRYKRMITCHNLQSGRIAPCYLLP
jgi:hypothetical protein